jgi:hypothetical protein
MKKNKQCRIKKQTVRNSKRSAKAKKRNYPRIIVGDKNVRMHCPVETTRDFEIGPSLVTVVKDGKTVEWNSWSSKQKQQPTKIAKEAIEENKTIKQSKKELIKNILMKAGYDPKKHYTRQEKKKFTRIVKNSLAIKTSKPVERSKEEWKELFKQQKVAKQTRFDALKYKPLPIKAGKQKGFTAAELAVKEKPNERKFKYTVQRRRSDDEKRVYDFKTDYFTASTRDEAKKKAAIEAKKYKKDTSFAGIAVQDIEGDNNIIYYDGKYLIAA